MRLFIFFVSISFVFFSCAENSRQEAKPGESSTSRPVSIVRTGVDIEPKLLQADSIQIIYYDDPDGDSLRYARFFTYLNTGDTTVLNPVKYVLGKPVSALQQAKKCRSEGKIYLLKGEDPVKTIYFSARSSDCSYLYFIKDGLFYYLDMPDAVKDLLKREKAKAVKP